jgi:hypothetical protein
VIYESSSGSSSGGSSGRLMCVVTCLGVLPPFVDCDERERAKGEGAGVIARLCMYEVTFLGMVLQPVLLLRAHLQGRS